MTARKKTAFRDAPASTPGVDPDKLADYLGGADIVRNGASQANEAPSKPARVARAPRELRSVPSAADTARDWTPPPPRKPRTLHTSEDLDFLDADDSRRERGFNLRLTNREKGALDFIDKHTSDSMHRFCVEAIRDAINTRLRKLAEVEI